MGKAMKKIIVFKLLVLISQVVAGQDLTDDQKYFHTYGLQYKLNKKSTISASYTGIAELRNFQFNYHDIGVNFTRDLSKKSELSLGADLIQIKQRETKNFSNYFRSNIEYGYHTRFKKLALSHELNVEYYVPKFNKFQTRWIYGFDVTYRKSFTSWKIKPYSKFKLYYYGNGKYLDYYDEESNLIARKSPNDIHRWRWYWGFKMKPHKQVSLVVAYFWNEEFNAELFKNSNINIYNKNKDGIRYPYNSFGAINLSLSYNLKFKKKKDDDPENLEQEKESIKGI
jgi:hypothetical protein